MGRGFQRRQHVERDDHPSANRSGDDWEAPIPRWHGCGADVGAVQLHSKCDGEARHCDQHGVLPQREPRGQRRHSLRAEGSVAGRQQRARQCDVRHERRGRGSHDGSVHPDVLRFRGGRAPRVQQRAGQR